MRFQVNGSKSFYSGLIYVAVGIGGFLWAQEYDVGSARRMGPGYFPALVGLVLAALGVAAIVRGISTRVLDPIPTHKLEPFLLILASVLSFALLINRAGLVVAILVSLTIACIRRIFTSPIETLFVFFCITAFCVLVFIYGFGLPIPLLWN